MTELEKLDLIIKDLEFLKQCIYLLFAYQGFKILINIIHAKIKK